MVHVYVPVTCGAVLFGKVKLTHEARRAVVVYAILPGFAVPLVAGQGHGVGGPFVELGGLGAVTGSAGIPASSSPHASVSAAATCAGIVVPED